MGLTQINLHHSKGASAVLARRIAVVHTHISLLQEPWIFRGCVRGIAACGRLFKSPGETKPRAAIAVKGVTAQLMPEFCSRDVVAVTVELIRANTGDRRKVVVCSAYFPHEGEVPPEPLDRLIRHCQEDGLPLVVGCDSNAHHVTWGSTDINDRGRGLLEYLVTTDLEILNRGGEPTFRTAARSEVLDLTLCSRSLMNSVEDWRVSQEPSLSDHMQIVFKLANVRPEVIRRRNPRKTDWTSFGRHLAIGLESFPRRHGTNEEVELCVEHLQRALISSFEASCPERTVGSNRKVSWWGPELQGLRTEARRAWNRARNTGHQSDWDLYRRAQKVYRDSILVAKRRSWKGFCESMESFPEASRLCRILARNPDSTLEAVRLPEGGVVSGEQCLIHLLETSFPGFSRETEDETYVWPSEPKARARGEDWGLAAKVVKPEKVKWAIRTFKPFKSAGPDGIFPALLQEGLELIIGPLTRTLRACLALGYVPKAWKLARVVFIPKMGRTCCSTAKDFRPISLTSFLLKTLEKLIDAYIRDAVLGRHPLHVNQHAYRAGYSTETALHALVSRIEGQLEAGGYTVGSFLDIEGAFNNTPHEVICREASQRGVPDRLVCWIRRMLRRRIVTSLGPTRVGGWVERGCPQGGVLSPLLWCLVIDGLLRNLNDRGIYAQGYADDLAILVRGSFIDTLMEVMQSALETTESWCRDAGLSINPRKTELVVFTRKYKLGTIRGPILGDVRLAPAESVKYLGVILDRKLLWREHLENRCRSVISYFWMCRRAVGQTWGLRPGMVHWIYSAILRPRLLYAAVVWWPRVQKVAARVALEHVRALILRGALGAIGTTPVAAMGILLNVEPFHLSIVAAAALAAHRLQCEGKWRAGTKHTKLPDSILSDPVFQMPQDRMSVKRAEENTYKVLFLQREDWLRPQGPRLSGGAVLFTDGSRTGSGSGAGIYCREKGIHESIPLGRFATVFQSEVMAIMRCAQDLLEIGGERISICSDSQAALKALDSPILTSRLVQDCREALEELARRNIVTLAWVPGHSGIRGNEAADQLAKAGSEAELMGPEPAIGIPYCLGKMGVRRWLRAQHLLCWRTANGCRQSRALLGDSPSGDLAASIKRLSRREAGLVTRMLTGHGTLNYHLHKLGLSDKPNCRGCDALEETSLHVLCDCPAYARARLDLLESAFLRPQQISSLSVGSLLRFWRRVGLG